MSPNGLPLEQEIRVISRPIIFLFRLGKRGRDFDDGNEDRDRKKGKLTGAFIMSDKTNTDCFIYGTIRYGKSYILATIVCLLLRTGKRVVYLPDCRELAKDPEDYIKLALILAYTDNIEKINEISACKTTNDIVAFCESSELLYFIVDQMNALDYRNNTEIVEVKKATILDVLNRMTSEHYYVKSSSANNESALYLIQKQTNDRKIELYGGFDEVRLKKCSMLCA